MVVTHRDTIINRPSWQLYLLTNSSDTTEVRPTMRIIRYTLLASIALLMFSVSATQSHAQINISIGAEPSCPYGTMTLHPTTAHPTATMARSGSSAVALSERDTGSTAQPTSTAM
jgi:hypothetical protein